MALAAAAQQQGSFSGVTNDQFIEYLFFTVTASGNYATNGDTLNFQGVTPLLISPFAALQAVITGIAGFVYSFVQGTTQANAKVKVLTGAAAQSPLTELTAGAYPGGVTGDTITGVASFPRA